MKLTSLSLVTGIAISGIVASGSFTPAQAVGMLLTTQTGYTGPALDLDEYATGENNYTNGPLAIPGGITFTSTAPFGSTLGQNSAEAEFYELRSNGIIGRTPVFAGLDSPTGELVFSFDTPVRQFGAFLNYAPGTSTDPTISTYDSSGGFLTAFNLRTDGGSISTPNGNNRFLFRGIAEESAVISSFRLSGSFIVAAGREYAPDLTVDPTAVPEPFTIIGTIVGGSAALRMRKKLKSTKV
ncbi:PEP-CTERM sorting domain-containing protein [Chamaesiphon sp.]|uniref:PEP-CTERM sorting domain-containing protein n=1 Tax=Chamaesiphon sp. TaxID=2814140 RepID=UPI003594881F